MPSSANPQHEPTMEEILASIRKIISEDSSEASAPKQEAEVLDLTQEVQEHSSAAAPGITPAGPDVPATHEAPRMTSSDEREADHEGIFSQRARQAIDDAFARIDQPEEWQTPSRAEGMATAEGDSVEAVFERAVRSAVGPLIGSWMNSHRDEVLGGVKPLIREWMDEHFPAILEGAIREEVARVVKSRGRR
jgi:uncharacterized protein